MQPAGRPAASRPAARHACSARFECSLSEPPRRMTALPDFQAQRAGIRGHVGAALVDDADDAERHDHALDTQPVRAAATVPPTVPIGSGSATHRLDARRRSPRCARSSRRSRSRRAALRCRVHLRPPDPARWQRESLARSRRTAAAAAPSAAFFLRRAGARQHARPRQPRRARGPPSARRSCCRVHGGL